MTGVLKITLITILVLILIIFIIVNILARSTAQDILKHPLEKRIEKDLWPPDKTPEDYGRKYEEVSVITEDGLRLTGWFLPGTNKAAVMIQHGSPGGRQDGLFEAAILNAAGFNVLLGSFRAHDDSDGDLITFGYYEQEDLKTWHEYLKSRDDIDPERIGLFGESMGGGTSILYAAANPGIKAVATASGFALTREVVETFIIFETDLPPALVPVMARFIIFWSEKIAGIDSSSLDTQAVIAAISPTPILIIHGGLDEKIGTEVGRELYDAAAEPKELLWFDDAGHVNFEQVYPGEYQAALREFFRKHLLHE